jgi:malonyl-ACP decarboxylase
VTAVVVTGMGVCSAAGYGLAPFAAALQNGRSLVQRTDDPQLSFPAFKAPLPSFEFRHRLDELAHDERELSDAVMTAARRAGRRTSYPVQVGVVAGLEAWAQAALISRPAAPERTGLIVAGQNTTQSYQYRLRRAFDAAPGSLSPEYAFQFLDTDHVGTLSAVLGIRGEGYTVGGASASGGIGVVHAVRAIRAGALDVCLVVGCLAELSPMELHALHSIGALAPQREPLPEDEICRPFDRQTQGFVPGEAAACLVLESAASAQARGAAALAELRSAVCLLGGTRHPTPDAAAEAAVMRRALAEAARSPADVDYVNAHGTGSPSGDAAEADGLASVFADSNCRPFINSTKGIVGHCLWSAGVVSVIATVLQMNGSFVHGLPTLPEPIRPLGWARQRTAAPIELALSNSFGFGGIHSAVAVGRVEAA